MRLAPLASALVLVLLLAGCQSLPAPEQSGGTPATASGSVRQLVAAGRTFDPVADDVRGTEACDGLSGRTKLADFDRVAWPELAVPAGDGVLRCGNATGAGWRHIADGHTGDFGKIAALVGVGWEDVAWFAIDRALEKPAAVEPYKEGIVNYDVLLEYRVRGAVERRWMVTVGVALDDGTIITSFPDERR